MNIEATEAELRASAKVFQLAAILDDRVTQPDKARIAAWAEQIHRHQLVQSDLLDGLQAFYDSPSERAIQIGDLIGHSRAVRRNRLEREVDADRERKRLEHDAKAADVLGGVAITGPTRKRTPRMSAAKDALQCVVDRRTAMDAIREYFAAKADALKSDEGKP